MFTESNAVNPSFGASPALVGNHFVAPRQYLYPEYAVAIVVRATFGSGILLATIFECA